MSDKYLDNNGLERFYNNIKKTYQTSKQVKQAIDNAAISRLDENTDILGVFGNDIAEEEEESSGSESQGSQGS